MAMLQRQVRIRSLGALCERVFPRMCQSQGVRTMLEEVLHTVVRMVDRSLPILLASLQVVFLPTLLFLPTVLGCTLAVHLPARLCFLLSGL